jgi:hypothetical protein
MGRQVLSGCAIFFLGFGLLALIGCGIALADNTGTFASDATVTVLLLSLGGIPAAIAMYLSRREAKEEAGSALPAIPWTRWALLLAICLLWVVFLVYLFFRNFRMHLGL